MNEQGNPLILVFYVDRQMFMPSGGQKPPIGLLSQSIDQVIKTKNMNAIAFFLPTDTQERIECINPAIVPQDAMDKINAMVKEIEGQFSINGKLEEDPTDKFYENEEGD